MLAFDVQINGERVSTAGLGNAGVLTAMLCLVRRASSTPELDEELHLDVGGLDSTSGEQLRWLHDREINLGDEVCIRVVEAADFDAPIPSPRDDLEQGLRAKQACVRQYAEELGWKIVTCEPGHSPDDA